MYMIKNLIFGVLNTYTLISYKIHEIFFTTLLVTYADINFCLSNRKYAFKCIIIVTQA